MGAETANIHLGSRASADLSKRLQQLEHVGKHWLVEAAQAMTVSTESDHAAWEKQSAKH